MNQVNHALERFQEFKMTRAPWDPHYQAVCELFYTREGTFTSSKSPGAFLQEDIYDNTGQHAAGLLASVLKSLLWPDAERTLVIRAVPELRKVQGSEAYFQWATEQMRKHMGNPRAGLDLAMGEHFLEQVTLGISALVTHDNDDQNLPLTYDAWGCKALYIDENAQGMVDTVYYLDSMTARQMVQEYGDKVSPKVREMVANKKGTEKLEVLITIEAKAHDKTKKGVAAMPYGTCHIDVKHKTLMREGGFEELPAAVVRFSKATDEMQGRSPAMTALPDAASANALKQAIILGAELDLKPPLGVLDSGRLGGSVIDLSPNAVNVFKTDGRALSGGENPIFPIFTSKGIQQAKELLEEFVRSIMSHFFLDRLLDLNNNVQMTAYETSVRAKRSGEAVGSALVRQEKEGITPTVERSFNILWRKGYLGTVSTGWGFKLRMLWKSVTGSDTVIVPEAIVRAHAAGLRVYEIEYISPAKRFQQGEKLQGIFQTIDGLSALAPFAPGVFDSIDTDDMARQIVTLSGNPSRLRTKDEVTQLRSDMQAQQAQTARIEAAKGMSEVARNAAQAKATMGTSGGGKK